MAAAAAAAPAALAAAAAGAGDVVVNVATTSVTPKPLFVHVWRLEGVTPEFFSGAAVGFEVKGEPFAAHGYSWQLRLFPNGLNQDRKGNVSAHLQLLTANVTAPVVLSLFSLAVDATDPLLRKKVSVDHFSTCKPPPGAGGPCWGRDTLLSHSELLEEFDAHAPGGVFTVTAALRLPGFEARTNPIAVPAPSLSAGLSALLASGKDADVTLLCGAERLAAHRLVLCMRSPVFAAQLDDGPLQVDASAVPVPPEITPHTLRRLLHFLYTDELEPASPEEATHLLNAADHYAVPRLFAICERTLCAALCVDNAAETLTLADQHSATALKDAALRFVAANAVAVMASAGWAHLVTARPPLVLETMHTMATGAPPLPPARSAPAGGAGGDAGAGAAGAGGEGATQRPRKRAR
jgi:speckle-type POZ protein